MNRVVEITIETEQVTSVCRRCRAIELWCDECGRLVLMISAEEATAILGYGLRRIFRELELGLFHFREEAGEEIFICLPSIVGRKTYESRIVHRN